MENNSIENKKNQNERKIILTEEQHKFITKKVGEYIAYMIAIGLSFLQIAEQCRLVNRRFKSKDSKLDEIQKEIETFVRKNMKEMEIKYDNLNNKLGVYSVVDYNTLKDKISTIEKEYKEIFKKFKTEIESKTSAFDERLEEIRIVIENNRQIAESIYRFIPKIEENISQE